MNILDITLLSVEEARLVPIDIRQIQYDWWLRTPGSKFNVAVVKNNGEIDTTGYYPPNCYDINQDYMVLRPALVVKDCFEEKFKEGSMKWIYIPNTNFAICESYIMKAEFDNVSNVYERSKAYQYIHDWAKLKNIL